MTPYPTLWRSRRAPAVLGDLFGVRRDMDRIFDSLLSPANGEAESMAVWSPVVDVQETEDGLHVSTELPGIKSQDVKVTVDDGVLTISGEKKREIEKGSNKDGVGYHLVERHYGRFERSFTLPRAVDADKVEARFEDGVLNIDLPKTEQAKPKQIAIK
ncbi:MAG: Hsp20/alpha crystallin family protein [Gemmatimonadales bacterium]